MLAAQLDFRSHAPVRRIDWLFNRFAGPRATNVGEFVKQVNRAYYKHSAGEYHKRDVHDIERQYAKVCAMLRTDGDTERVVVNIGGGTGFEYQRLRDGGVRWSRYVFIEPDSAMAENFRRNHGDAAEGVEIFQGEFQQYLEHLSSEAPRLFVINSCLHHIIWLEEFLDSLGEAMRPGDQLLLGHEPNNSYLNSPFMLSSYALRSLTSDVLSKRIGLWRSKASRENSRRWVQINDDLLATETIKLPMPAICIRRIIDYWVGSKGDWRRMQVPRECNEGFWTPADIQKYLGGSFQTRYFRTYRHFGDPGGSRFTRVLNQIAERVAGGSGGSQFFMLLERQS